MFINLQLGEKVVTPRVRLLEPLSLMKKLYDVDFEITEDNVKKREGELFLIRARLCQTSLAAGIRFPVTLYNGGCLYIYEIDDSIYGNDDYIKSSFIDFIGAHAITCSTEALAEELKEFNANVKVFKNQIATLLPEKEPETKDHITIFYGALNRRGSYENILSPLNKIAEKYAEKLRFTVIYDTNFYEKLHTPHKTLVKESNKSNLVSYDRYIKELYNSDIALLPLKNTAFNVAKSDLKFIESANASVAVLASPTVYENTVKDGETGFIYKSPREFREKLEILINDNVRRTDISKHAHDYVKNERQLINHIEERYDWMREMYAKKDELHNELLKRYEVLLNKLEKTT